MDKTNLEKNDYPIVLEVVHIQEILGVSKRRAYEIMDIEGFPLIKNIGRQKKVHRDRFFQWLEQQAS